MKKFTKSIYSIIVLCQLLLINVGYSKSTPISDKVVFGPAPILSAATRTPTGISFTTPVIAGTTYLVSKSTNNGPLVALGITPTVAGAVNTFTDAFVPVVGSSYTYSVKAILAAVESTPSTVTSCSVNTPTFTTVPNLTTPPLGTRLNISNLVAGSTYSVSRRPLGGTFAQVATGLTNLTTHFDPFTPVPGTTYEYTITATNGPTCTQISSIVPAVFNALTTPAISNVTPITSFLASVDWTTAPLQAGLSRWYLERKPAGGAFAPIHDSGPTQMQFEDGRNAPKLLPNTNYCYRVRYSTNGGFFSPWSADKCVTTPALPVVTNLTATANNCSRITLNWTEPSPEKINEEAYRIFRSENGGPVTLLKLTGNNISTYVDDNLKPNTTYTYYVAGIYESIEAPRAGPVTATTKPSILTLTSSGATFANVMWDKCTNLSQGWKLYLSTNGSPYVEIAQTGPQEDSYQVKNLLPETKYSIFVINTFGTGFGGASNAVNFTTTKFPAPTNLKATALGNSSIKVTWTDNSNNGDNEDAFILYRSIDNGVNFTPIQLPPVFTEYTDSDNLKPSQKVCYYVAARFSSGFSNFSNTGCELTCPVPLTEFTKITAVSPTQIDLQWAQTENFGPTKIVIQSSLDGVNFTVLEEIPGTATSYKDLTLLPNQKKYYRANVINEGTCSSVNSLVASTTSCPLPPTNIIAKALDFSSIEVNWDLGVKMKTYIIERSTDNIDFVKAGEVDGAISKFVDKDLASSKKYYYRVLAINEGCTSGPSQVKQESTATTCASPPSNLVAVANSEKEIKVSYKDNSPDENGFELEISKNGTNFVKLGTTIEPNTTSITISSGIDPETKYFFRIRAIGALCNSDFSNVASVTTNPPAPTGLTAKGVKINQVDLEWKNTSKTATSIEIQRASSADNSFTKLGTDVANTVSTFQNTGLTPSTGYKYRIRYNSPNGVSEWSNVADGTTFVITANEDNTIAKQIVLYPVPTDKVLYVKTSSSILGKVSTKIINASGNIVITQDFNNGMVEGKTEQINVSDLSSGIYFLEVSTKKGTATKKFLKR
jgi:hypothetical protein